MSVSCTLRYQGSDSLQQDVTLHVLPAIGEVIYIDGVKGTVSSIDHEISITNQTHKIVVTYTST